MSDVLSLLSSSDDILRIFDHCDIGMVLTDQEGNILDASPKMVEITGFARSEVIGSHTRMFRSAQTPAATHRRLWNTINRGETWKGPLVNQKKDGSRFIDREVIFAPDFPLPAEAHFMAIHREAREELELQVKLREAGEQIHQSEQIIEGAKDQIAKLIHLTASQAEAAAHAFIAALEARDRNTAGHGMRTAALMDVLGEELGVFTSVSRDAIRIGAIMHDLGKIGIPDSILLKPGKLTDAEYEVMKQHPAIGFQILKNVLRQPEPLMLIRHHHERLDGSGYPDGLRWDQIPDYVKTFSVIDCFDALTSPRPYRPAMSADQAISILTDDALSGKLDRPSVNAIKRLVSQGLVDQLFGKKLAA